MKEGKVLAIMNCKGGCGKSTTCASLGEAFALRGKKVLLVDLDSQASLTSFFLKEEVTETIYDSLVKKKELPVKEISEGLYLCPSCLELAKAETELSSRIARERILYNRLKPIRKDFDLILLDCGPNIGVVTMNALVACSGVIVPLLAEGLSLQGLKIIDEVIDEVREALNSGIEIIGIVLTRYNNRNLNKAVLDSVSSRYGDKLFETTIRENIALAEAAVCGGDIFQFAPKSNGALDYSALAEEVDERINKK